jgi:hypothetical protein
MFVLIMQVADEYVLEVTEAENLKNEAIFVLCKLVSRVPGSLTKINNEMVPYLLEQLVGNLSNLLAEKIVYLLCLIVKEEKEYSDKWLIKQPRLLETLKRLDEERVQSANYLVSQLSDDNVKKKRG